MEAKTTIWMGAIAVGLGLTLFTQAFADAPMHGRVSYEAGGALVRGMDDDDWSFATMNTLVLPGDVLWAEEEATLEMEMSGGSFLRMADGSRAEVESFPPNAKFQAWWGAFYLHRVSRSTGNVVMETPAASVEVERDTMVRIDVTSNGATTVSVRWGRARVRTAEGGAVTVSTGRRVYVDPGYLPSSPVSFDRSREDEFDRWNRERAQVLAEGFERSSGGSITSSAMGVSDLHHYGEWVTVDSRRYWRPTVVREYVPYRVGYWSYTPRVGHVWVGTHPFSYITTHYGRWTYHRSYGWIWGYRPGWSPAWAYTVRSGDRFVWAPLDFYDRPVVVGSAYFTVGSTRIGLHGASYSYASHVLYGPARVYPARDTTIITSGDVHIWNIYASGTPGRGRDRYRDTDLPVRDYSPRRVIRGPDTVGAGRTQAQTRAASLQDRIGRQQFAAVDRTGRENVRTAERADARSAAERSVRLRDPDRPSATVPGEDGRLRLERDSDDRMNLREMRTREAARRTGEDEERRAADSRVVRGGGGEREAEPQGLRGVGDRAAERAGIRDTSDRTADRTGIRDAGERAAERTGVREPGAERTRVSDEERDASRTTVRDSGDRGAERTRITGDGRDDMDRERTPIRGESAETPRATRAPERSDDASPIRTLTPRTTAPEASERSRTDADGRSERSERTVRQTPPDRTSSVTRTPERESPSERSVTRDSSTSRSPADSGERTIRQSTPESTSSISRTPARESLPRRPVEPQSSASQRESSRQPSQSAPDRPSVRSAPQSTPQRSAPQRESSTPRISGSAPRIGSDAPRASGSAPRVGSDAPRVSGSAPRVSRPDTSIRQPQSSAPRSSGSTPDRGSSSSLRSSTPDRSSGSSLRSSTPNRSSSGSSLRSSSPSTSRGGSAAGRSASPRSR